MHSHQDDGQIAQWLGDRQESLYADGRRCDEIQYLQCKLILKPNHFTSRQSLFDFAKVLRRPARETGVYFDPVTGQKTELGEVHADAAGAWTCPPPKECDHDWVVVVTKGDR